MSAVAEMEDRTEAAADVFMEGDIISEDDGAATIGVVLYVCCDSLVYKPLGENETGERTFGAQISRCKRLHRPSISGVSPIARRMLELSNQIDAAAGELIRIDGIVNQGEAEEIASELDALSIKLWEAAHSYADEHGPRKGGES